MDCGGVNRRGFASPCGGIFSCPPPAGRAPSGMGRGATGLRWTGALASGGAVALLIPPFNFGGLAWLALAPMLIALWSVRGKRAGLRGFLLGWAAGALSFGLQLWWISVVSSLGAMVMAVYLGLFWGLFGWFAATIGNPWRERDTAATDPRAERRARMMSVDAPGKTSAARASLRTAFCHGAVWAGLEWLRSWLFTGFGWNGLGVAFHETLVMAQAADLLGVAGLSLVLVFFQATFVQAGRRLFESAREGKRCARWDFIVAATVIALLMGYGLIRMAATSRTESVRLKALLIQLNIPHEGARQLWDMFQVHQGYEEETAKALEEIAAGDQQRLKDAMDASNEGGITTRWPDWVLWPESALTGRLLRADDGAWGMWMENMETIRQVRQAGPFSLIYGLNELEADLNGENLVQRPKGRAFNSLVTMTPEDDLQSFRKRHLVIFGETIPFVDSLPWLKKIYEQQSGQEFGGSFSPGDSLDPLPMNLNGTPIGIIPSICFEDTVPRLTRRFVRSGPQLIVNVTNDGWFKESPAAAQHFANARFRAIELRRPMLRCANSGVSAAIQANGSTSHPNTGKPQILRDQNGSHFTRGSLLAEIDIPLQPGFSLYAVIGDWGIILIALSGLSIAWLTRRTA